LIGLSPLPTAHPSSFQPTPVRTSIRCYADFILAMGRSLSFGSTACYSIALFRLAFASATPLNGLTLQHTSNSLAHYAKGTPSSRKFGTPTDCKHTVSGTISLPSQGYFSPFPHGTGSLSVTSEYLALGDGPPGFPQDFSCPVVLGNLIQKDYFFSPTGLSPSMVGLS
jgi:hypothetical protein